jgi:uncharacterized protein (TIGR03083 family)
MMTRDPEAGPPDWAQLVAEAVAGLPAETAELAEYTAGLIRACASKFHQTDPDASAWTFGPPPTAAFWMRRAAMEEAVHLRDAEEMEGRPSQVPLDIALDGIDELTDIIIPFWLSHGLPLPARSVRIEPSDTQRRWLLKGSEVHTEPAVVSGGAGDIFVALWGRDAPVSGNADAFRTWAELSALF